MIENNDPPFCCEGYEMPEFRYLDNVIAEDSCDYYIVKNSDNELCILDKDCKLLFKTKKFKAILPCGSGLFAASELLLGYEFGNDLAFHSYHSSNVGQWCYIDCYGNEITKPLYAIAYPHINGQAIVAKGKWVYKEDWENYKHDKKYSGWWVKEDETYGIIDTKGNEIMPCIYDECASESIDGTENLYFVHRGGWATGKYYIYDTKAKTEILELDFDFDLFYMFNSLFLTKDNLIVFDEHDPKKHINLISVYSLTDKEWLIKQQVDDKRTYKGKKSLTVTTKDGHKITVF